jgi:hypothetical protein
LWAPFAFAERESRVTRGKRNVERRAEDEADRGAHALSALDDAVQVARGTPFEVMLSDAASRRIAAEVRAACERLNELEALLAEPAFDVDAAAARVLDLERDEASTATRAAARRHLRNVQRLVRLRAQQEAALRELEQALGALHSQLVVSHYAGSSSDGVDAIVSDLWVRVEGLGDALEAVDAVDSGLREAS